MSKFNEAQLYTGNTGDLWSLVGKAQLNLLLKMGCSRDSLVGEIGCGSLCGGHAIIDYLNIGKYIGVEPNSWLVDAALEANPLILKKLPKFNVNSDFKLPEMVDFVISHSILSHAAHWQLKLFFKILGHHCIVIRKFSHQSGWRRRTQCTRLGNIPGILFLPGRLLHQWRIRRAL